jgi:hypothetical protein
VDNYVIEFEEVKNNTIEEFIEFINKTEGKKIADLKVKDLTYQNDQLIFPGHGIYIFRNNKEIILVGKATSTSFTERLAKHFDIRPGAWFNRLMYVICCRLLKIEKNDENYKIASKFAFENVDLVLVNFQNRVGIEKIERLLRSSTNTLNKFKNLKLKDYNIKVCDY